MTRLRNTCRSVSLVLVLTGFILGCTRPPSGPKEAPAEEPAAAGDTRGFDPLELPSDREIIPTRYPRPGTISGRQALVNTESGTNETDSALVDLDDLARGIDSLNSQAFRVQVFTSKLYQEARATARVAEEIFDQPVYVDYQVPNFKVRVGNFINRDEAESYAQRAKAAGYSGAWVVMVNIGVREAAPLYYDDVSGLFPEEPPIPKDSAQIPGSDE